jgi:glycerol-3-phosphate dehydrogenase (NAD(P)+)
MGDLVLTCTDNLSRNRRMGLAIAQGRSIADTQHDIGQVVEGVVAAKAVHQVADTLGVEMPICQQIYRILHEGAPPRDAVAALMGRALKPED